MVAGSILTADMFKPSANSQGKNLVLEILMIVVGINVALWFEGWFQELEDIETEAAYLADLRTDLLADIVQLDAAIEAGTRKAERAADVVDSWDAFVAGSQEEQASTIFMPSSYVLFTPQGFTFDSMQESGDFRLLRDARVKKALLSLDRQYQLVEVLQSNFLQALDDEYIPLMMQTFDIATMQVSDPALFDSQMFRNFFVYTKQDTSTMVYVYREARAEAEALLALLPES